MKFLTLLTLMAAAYFVARGDQHAGCASVIAADGRVWNNVRIDWTIAGALQLSDTTGHRINVVLEVLQTVLEVDEALRERLVELVVKKDVTGARDLLRPLVEIRAAHPHPPVEMERLLKAIANRCIDGIIAPFEVRWRQMYDQLVAYKESEGDCNVPYYYEDGRLHRWTVVQRKRHEKEGVLSLDRVRLLNEIGFCWDLDKATWDQFIKELRDYYAEHGSWSISQKTRLGRKLADVRGDWRRDKLDKDKIDQLTAMGVPRDARTALDEIWIQTVNELHALNWKVANETHRAFVGHQRSAKKKDKLAPEREAILNEKGFPWQPHAEAWEEMYERFCAWKKTGGKLDKRLKSWISNQRTEYAAGRVPKERAERVEKAGLFRDGTLDGRWQKRLEQYRAGDWSKAVLAWLVVQRQKYHGTRQGKLSDIQIAALEASPGFSWDPASWKDRDENCCAKGHAYTPENTYVHKDGSRRCRQCRRVTIDRRYKKEPTGGGTMFHIGLGGCVLLLELLVSGGGSAAVQRFLTGVAFLLAVLASLMPSCVYRQLLSSKPVVLGPGPARVTVQCSSPIKLMP